jgi:phage portal protein BeeE
MSKEREVWSEQKWLLIDIMEQYGVDVDMAEDIGFKIGNAFEERMIELGWDVMDSLIQTYEIQEEIDNAISIFRR